jgi:hypothetical protein
MFKISWKPRADGIQKMASYMTFNEILEAAPQKTMPVVMKYLALIIGKYGTFGEF